MHRPFCFNRLFDCTPAGFRSNLLPLRGRPLPCCSAGCSLALCTIRASAWSSRPLARGARSRQQQQHSRPAVQHCPATAAAAVAAAPAALVVAAGSCVTTWPFLWRTILCWTQSGYHGEPGERAGRQAGRGWQARVTKGMAGTVPDACSRLARPPARSAPAALSTARSPSLSKAGSPDAAAGCWCREEGGLFRFCLPLQDLVNVDLQPEIYFRWG